jgi:hypothetical protein
MGITKVRFLQTEVGRHEYRRRAQQCLELAAAFSDREARASLSYMAQVWLLLADRYQGAEDIRAAVQQRQQQQIQPKDDDKDQDCRAANENPAQGMGSGAG